LVEALKQRALKNGRSAEMEHRAILREVLLVVKKRSFLDALMAMPPYVMIKIADFKKYRQ
jgi:plasmid stability protein